MQKLKWPIIVTVLAMYEYFNDVQRKYESWLYITFVVIPVQDQREV